MDRLFRLLQRRPSRRGLVPAAGAGEVIVEQVHAGSGIDYEAELCEELWCLDSDNIPAAAEMSPMQAILWGEVYAEVELHCWPAFCAWVSSSAFKAGGDHLPDYGAFSNRYCGGAGIVC